MRVSLAEDRRLRALNGPSVMLSDDAKPLVAWYLGESNTPGQEIRHAARQRQWITDLLCLRLDTAGAERLLIPSSPY